MAAPADRNSSRRSFLSVIASAYLLNFAGRVADILWLLLLFTVLAVDQVAVFALASAAAAFFSMGLDAGLNQTLLREFSSHGLTLRRGARIALGTRATLLAIAALAGGLWIAIAEPADDLIAVIAVACAVQLWIVVEQFCQQWLKANDRQTLANALAATEPFLKLAAAGVLVIGNDTVTALEFFAVQNVYHCLLMAACVVACIWSGGSVAPTTIAPSPLPVILRASSWFALMGLITVAQNRVDWLLVANYASETATASYSLVNRAYEVLMLVIGTGAMTLFPLLCRARESRHDLSGSESGIAVFRKAVLAAGTLAAGAATLLLPAFCNWIWRDKYPGADALFAMLMPVACLSTFIQMMYYEAIASRAEARLIALGIVSTLAQLTVNALLVPSWGATGAVVGMLTLASGNITLYFLYRKRLGLPPLAIMVHLAGYAIAIGILWLTLALVVNSLWLQLGMGCIVWTLFSYCWLLDAEERSTLRNLVSSVRLRLASAGGGAR